MLNLEINNQNQSLENSCQLKINPGAKVKIDLESGGHWFGHGFSHVQPFPLETGEVINPDFAVNNIQSPIWLASAGYALFAETNGKISININHQQSGEFRLEANQPFTLHVFKADDLPTAHQELMDYLNWSRAIPKSEIFGDSIFCTWTQYPRCITQERIVDMACQIRKHQYPCSIITIDDRWESCFGELSFSQDFPNPKDMVKILHQMDFKILLWVTPFVNQEAEVFNELQEKKILVPAKDGSGASLLKWWGGTAGLIDLTNPDGRKWFRNKLIYLKKKIGIDGFKIDGGDAKYQPPIENSQWHDYQQASGYVDKLLEVFEEVAPLMCESRTAWLSQNRQIIWRLGGKDSHWGLDNGLKAMVTLAMQVSLMGYDLLIPDMIPGRVQTLQADLPLPTDEFMVRWIEASAFMPIMQYSYFPWNYASETSKVAQQYAMVHKQIEPYLVEQAKKRSAPLLRPLWYDYPEEQYLYRIPDQFMLGSDLVVAPILDEIGTYRPVILPPGNWKDAWNGKELEGGQLEDYPAPCPGIPVFVRTKNQELFNLLNQALGQITRNSVKTGKTTTTYSAGLDRDLSVTG